VLLRAAPHRQTPARRAAEAHAWQELESLAHVLRAEGVAAEALVRCAEPGAAIVDAVRDFDASAVVRSSYDGCELAGWLRRSIVDEVMHQIEVPVLIVPAGEAPTPTPGSRLRLLVPLDGSALAESALVHVLQVAGPRPLDIRLIHVVQLQLGPLATRLPSVPDSKAARRATTRYLHDLAATLRVQGAVTETDVVESQDSVGRVLLDVARRSAVNVVVMTAHGRNSRDRLPQGRVTTDVLEHCPVPVLLVPNPSGIEPLLWHDRVTRAGGQCRACRQRPGGRGGCDDGEHQALPVYSGPPTGAASASIERSARAPSASRASYGASS
jgi:nucleotide-binding universal stress UspA family protein